jgi:hypothetical protein
MAKAPTACPEYAWNICRWTLSSLQSINQSMQSDDTRMVKQGHALLYLVSQKPYITHRVLHMQHSIIEAATFECYWKTIEIFAG